MTVYDAFTRKAPDENSERVYFIAKRTGKKLVIIEFEGEFMADYIIRATAADGQIRAFASTTKRPGRRGKKSP